MTTKTFIFLKPDAIERKLAGKIISRFEEKGFSIVEVRCVVATSALLESHYAEHKEKPFFSGLVNALVGKTVVCIVWQGSTNIVSQVRTMIGDANPEKRLPGTIRGDYSSELVSNLIHSSDSAEAVKREIEIWLPFTAAAPSPH